MRCPYCGARIPNSATVCPECNHAIEASAPVEETPAIPRDVKHILIVCACWIFSLIIAGLAIYRIYFWIDTYRINRLYLRGDRAPSVSEIMLEDGRPAHTITFFADTGDQIFIKELNKSYVVSGGFARLVLPDSTWFHDTVDLTDVESANVALTPVLIKESGDQIQLPLLKMNITAPQSPLTIINPARDGAEVYTAIFTLQVQVVYGSKVYVNGNDVSDLMDRGGLLSYNLNVYPVGDNTITVLVRTPDHKETRHDVVVYRAEMEIPLELSSNIMNESATETMTISGKCDPEATFVVDSPHIEESVVFDRETGDFRFLAKFSTIGENTVAFHASKPGMRDSVIRFPVKYLPGEDDYSKLAWSMDYEQLMLLFEQWKGRIFKCVGPVIDTFEEDGVLYFVMDVGTEGFQELVVLGNFSERTDITAGFAYAAYADVEGRKIYNAAYCPLLNARYVYKRETQ